MISRVGLSKSMAALPARLTLRTPDGQTVVAGGNGSPVTVTGEPQELLLFAFGRAPSASTSAGMTMSSPRCGRLSAAFERSEITTNKELRCVCRCFCRQI